jgi:hypothetical protein
MAKHEPIRLVQEAVGGGGSPFTVVEPLFHWMLQRVRVDGDGSCLFYSFLVASGQSIEGYMRLRLACADFAASKWHIQIPGKARGSIYAACLNDSYRDERSNNKATFKDLAAYVQYITGDRAWAGMMEIHIVSALWRRPILVWKNEGVLSPGMIGYQAGAPPIHVVYSGGNHYDALCSSVDTSAMISVVLRLHERNLQSTLTNQVDVVDLDPKPVLASMCCPIAASDAMDRAPPATDTNLKQKRKRILETEGTVTSRKTQLNNGVRRAHDVWRVGFRPRDLNNKLMSRKTLPFDYSTEEEAERVYRYFSKNRGGKSDNETFGILNDQIKSIDAIIASLQTETVDKVLDSLQHSGKVKTSMGAVPMRDAVYLRGVSYDANRVLVVRQKLPDVLRKPRVYKVPFHYVVAREAGLAYDYAVTYFCELLNQKSSHLLNFPSETLCYSWQLELRSFVEEVVLKSYSFQVGKSLPAIPLLRDIDLQGGEPVQWKIRLFWTTTSLAFVVLVPHLLFES